MFKVFGSLLGGVNRALPKGLAGLKSASNRLGGAGLMGRTFPTHNIKSQLIIQGVFAGITMMGNSSPQEKMRALSEQGMLFWMTGNMSMGRQIAMQMALRASSHMPDLARRSVTGYRNYLDSRTMSQIPFSHSNLPMDLAFSSMQYSQQRMSGMYSIIGNEAIFMHNNAHSR